MSTEIAGLSVKNEPDGLMTPISAVAVIKGLNAEGKVVCWQVATGGRQRRRRHRHARSRRRRSTRRT